MARQTDSACGTDDTDSLLVESAKRGDKDALGQLLCKHRAIVVRMCQKILDDASLSEDAVQEAGLLAMLNIGSLRKPASFRAWLCGIALNVCHRLLLARGHEVESSQDWLDGENTLAWCGQSAEELSEVAEVRTRVRAAVATLPQGQRTAVVMFYLSCLTYSETATLLGTTVSAVKTRLHKGRTALRTQLWDLWEGAPLGGETAKEYVPVRVIDVRHSRPDIPSEFARPAPFVAVLQEADGARRFPIWIGRSEATWLALSLEGKELVRPGTFQFASNLLNATGGRLKEVRITRIAPDETIYAETIIEVGGGKTATIDARPSDALNLALLTDAPVFVEAHLLDAQQHRTRGYISNDNVLARVYPDGPRELIAEHESKYIKPRGRTAG